MNLDTFEQQKDSYLLEYFRLMTLTVNNILISSNTQTGTKSNNRIISRYIW